MVKLKWIRIGLGMIGCLGCNDTSAPLPSEVEVISEIRNETTLFLNRPARLVTLQVESTDLQRTRQVEIRIMAPTSPYRGDLVLTSGGFGTTFYGIGLETNSTLHFALNAGLRTFEIKWLGPMGWGSGMEGAGYPKAVRALGAVIRYLKQKKEISSGLVIAHGGSGGSFQIAYGLTRFQLENDIHQAILVAGPPTSKLELAIFGDQKVRTTWPDGIGGFRITDYIHGWDKQGQYCQNRSQIPPHFVISTLDDSSLLPSRIPMDLTYQTPVYFVNTFDHTHADAQGRLFFEAIQSSKEWHYISNETSHDVAGVRPGAEKIREILRRILDKNTPHLSSKSYLGMNRK